MSSDLWHVERSSIEWLDIDIAQFGSYYVREVGLPFVDSCKDLSILVDTELKSHGYIRSIVVKYFGISVNVLKLNLLCCQW